MVLNSELNAANMIDKINSLIMPKVTFSFSLVKWSHTSIHKMDGKVGKILTNYRMHHPKSKV